MRRLGDTRGAPEDETKGTLLRVLLVEDSENDAILLLRELRRGGYEPLCERVSTPEEMERALEDARARREEWEVVVSDYYMPRFDAPDALALLRKLGYDTPFIVVSGKIGEEAAVGLMRAGAQDYVAKEDMARLCPAIERELREAVIRSEREGVERALKGSEERFRRLVEQAADAVFVHDLDGSLVDVNRQACEALGYAREELLARSISEIETAWAPGSLVELWREVIDRGPRTYEGIHRRKDGTTFPAEVRVGVLESEGQQLMLALARDVTERKEAEKRLWEAEMRFRTLVERIPAITYIQSPYGTKPMEYVSPQLKDVLGYSADEEVIDDEFLFRTLHPEDRDRFVAEDRRTDETGEPFRAEYRQLASDGHEVWFRDEAVLVRDEEGRPLYWLGVQYDITDRKRIEEEGRASEERYRTFIEQSTEGIWRFEFEEKIPTDLPEDEQIEVVYRHGYLAECNDAMARMYGYGRAEELVGTRLADLLPPSDPQNVEYLRAAIRSGYRLTDAESSEPDLEGNTKHFLNNLTGMIEEGNLVRVWGSQRDVTARKNAEVDLKESEERFRATFDQAAVGIVQVALDGAWIRFNDKFCDILGYTREELAKTSVFDLVTPQDFETDFERGVAMLAGELGDYSEEKLVVGKDGVEVWINLTVSLVHDASDEPTYFIAVAEDITKRREAEEALRQSEELYRTVVEQAAENIFVVDVETKRILEANTALQRSLGYAPEELKEMTLYDIVAHDQESIERNVERILAEGRRFLGERRYRRKDGGIVYVEVSASAIPYGNGEAMCVVAHDVTGRKRVEEDLRESEERYRAVVEQSAEGIYFLDTETRRIVETNPAMQEMFGYSADEFRDLDLYDLIAHPREEIDANLARTLEADRRFVGERQHRRRDGTLVDVEVAVSMIQYGGREVMCVVLRDITGRKETERKLREVREAERDRIARDLHDEILQDIVYALQEIQIIQITTRDGGDPQLEDAAEALRRSVEGLRSSIFELRVGKLSHSFVASLQALVDLNRRMVRNRYRLEMSVEEGFPQEVSESAGRQLTRVFQEALANVRRHANARRVEVKLWREGENAYVEVADDGRGFEPVASDVGFGLQSMSQRALDLGGELEVESYPERGTRVRVRVPVSRLIEGWEDEPPDTGGV